MGKKYLPVIVRSNEYKLFTDDLAKIHRIIAKPLIRIPPYLSSTLMRKETHKTDLGSE